MTRPILLDLFCGAGGAAMGYYRAGFDVVGVDHVPQPHYPFPFVRGDALAPPVRLAAFDAIHASPPCQAYSIATRNERDRGTEYPDHVADVRDMLAATGRPYVIENVPGSPLQNWIQVCGSGLGMRRIRRHRWFESNVALWGVPCAHGQNRHILSVVGHGEHRTSWDDGRPSYLVAARADAMGIDWMPNAQLTQAVPPAFTEFIGGQLLDRVT